MPGVFGITVGGGDIVAGQPGSLLGLHRHVLASATLASVLRSLGDQTIVLPVIMEKKEKKENENRDETAISNF